ARVERLERRREHGRVADRAPREEGDVPDALDLGHQGPEAEAEAHEVEERLDDVAEHALGREFLPNEVVAPPDGDPRGGDGHPFYRGISWRHAASSMVGPGVMAASLAGSPPCISKHA